MPIDLEMLLSSSNNPFQLYPIGSTTYSDNTFGRSLSFSHSHCMPRPLTRCRSFVHNKADEVFGKNSSYKLTDAVSNRKFFSVRKKKVSFADDKGFKLVEVCEIPGAPKWADDVITLLIGSTKRSVVKEKKWKVAFDHPPWPDEKLMDTVEKNKVALEHVSVKEGTEDILLGSVRVKNLAFEKSVFLRLTFDRWLSYTDVPCSYKETTEKSLKTNSYDTFSFSSKILPVASRYEVIEFCICFQCNDKEYWDNNGGINYRLILDYSKPNLHDL